MSAKTDYLITNDTDSGSVKNQKAAELGIVVITEDEFLKMAE
jgi:DNA ligase (NAD+)